VENTAVQDHSFQNHKKAASAVLWLKIYWQKYLVEPMISRILKFAFEKKINNTKKMIYFGILGFKDSTGFSSLNGNVLPKIIPVYSHDGSENR
jgi:hypothetical protein